MKKTIYLLLTIVTIITIAISIPQATALTPSVITSSPSSTDPTSGAWTNPTNAYVDNTGNLVASNAAYSTSLGQQQKYHGYGFSIPLEATISSVRVRMDQGSTASSNINLEVSADGGSTFLPFNVEKTTTTQAQVTFWIDITSWNVWTPSNLNNDQIWVKVTHTGGAAAVLLDWIPVEVTYSSTTNSPSLTDPASEGWGNPTGAYADDSIISASLAAYSVTGTAFAPQKYHGYGFLIPLDSTINSVRVRLDAASVQTSAIKLEVSADGGATFLTPPATAEIITNGLTGSTYWVDITSWTNWTPENLNNDQIWVMVTRSGVGNTVYLDWIPIEVTYKANIFNVPEYALAGLGAIAACFIAFIAFKKRATIVKPQI